jgi:adenine deaminase
MPLAIQAVTRAGANPKRVCVCTDDRDADDLFLFGLDWVVREAVKAGVSPLTAWSMGSLHPATRYGMDGEFGALGHGRRADIVLLDDALKPRSTWYGGVPVVDEGRITPVLEAALSDRYRYPAAAYRTVHFRDDVPLIPALPASPCTANILRVALPGIITFHDQAPFEPAATWKETLAARPDLCFVTVVERHGKNGGVGHGLLKDFGLAAGAVASTVGHDAHNLIVAGRDEGDMRLAVETLKRCQGGVCVVRDGRVVALVEMPVAGLLSDKRAGDVAEETVALKKAWNDAGCTLPYMGFNLLPLSVIPEVRITDKGLVTVPGMEIVPLFQA